MKVIRNVKKNLAASFLVVGLMGSGSANAVPVEDWMNAAAQWGEFAEGIVQTGYQAVIEAKTTIMQAIEKASWVKQLKSMYETYENAVEAKEKAEAAITGLTDVSTLITDITGQGSKNSVFASQAKAPDAYVPSFDCGADGKCTPRGGNGYVGEASGITSEHVRETYKAMPRAPGGSLFGIALNAIFPKSMELKYAEASETNAQQIAVINAMALEAYTQANNRVAKIQELRDAIVKVETAPPGADKENNLKRVADLQAQIQSYGANLQNEQTKLASLAILQQSQKDGYEQHKKEIMLTAFRTKADEDNSGFFGVSSETIKRGLVLGASWGVLQAMANPADPADPNSGVVAAARTLAIPAAVVPNLSRSNVTTIANGRGEVAAGHAALAAQADAARLANRLQNNAAIQEAQAAANAQAAMKNTVNAQVAADRAALYARLLANNNLASGRVGTSDTARADTDINNVQSAAQAESNQNQAGARASAPVGTASVDGLRNQGQQASTNAANNVSLNSAATTQAIADNTAAINALATQLANQPAPTPTAP